IFEKQLNENQGSCPGTDKDLRDILWKIKEKPYFNYYKTTIDQQVQEDWNENPEFKRLLNQGGSSGLRTKCIEAITQWKARFAKQKINKLQIDH
ncbi:MAG: hypothetical protein GY861_06600, partial [bacterium]|nr:hypothetical protein [bacterium]